jgi:hypothetical protein
VAAIATQEPQVTEVRALARRRGAAALSGLLYGSDEQRAEGTLDLMKSGEVIHLIERRMFPDDVRRHFVGEVEVASDRGIRLRGYLFVYDSDAGKFPRKAEVRTRVVPLDNRVVISVLPEGISIVDVHYVHDEEGNLSITDGREFELDISEFSAKE